MRALIVADGPAEVALTPENTRGYDLVVATDGAARKFCVGTTLTAVIGDVDSLTDEARSTLVARGVTIVIDASQEECNDLEKAVRWLLQKGATVIEVRDAFGGRLDQSFASLSLLIRYRSLVSLSAHSPHGIVRVLGADSGECHFSVGVNDTVSLAPLHDLCEVSLAGVQWPLRREILEAGTRGVSNVSLNGEVIVEVHSGLVVFTHLPR